MKILLLFTIIFIHSVLAWSGDTADDIYGRFLLLAANKSEQFLTENKSGQFLTENKKHIFFPKNLPEHESSENEILQDEQKRLIRQTLDNSKSCSYPDLKDSSLRCLKYSDRVKCKRLCIFGHTLQSGIMNDIQCKFEENKWIGLESMALSWSAQEEEFVRIQTDTVELCQPFVDCSVTLGFGGKSRCYGPYLHKGPSCEFSCERFEDYDPVPSNRYECDILGRWYPELPHCIKAGTKGLKLVPPPKGQNVHAEI